MFFILETLYYGQKQNFIFFCYVSEISFNLFLEQKDLLGPNAIIFCLDSLELNELFVLFTINYFWFWVWSYSITTTNL